MTTWLSPDLLRDMVILVVDDEMDSVFVAEQLLKLMGATVITADNGHDAFEKTKVYLPDVIISDLSMPQASGWEFIRLLKANPQTATIPIVALTAHAMRGDRQKVLDAGFDNYLSKPLALMTFVQDLLLSLSNVPQIATLLEKNA